MDSGLGWLVSGKFDRCVKVSNQLHYTCIYVFNFFTQLWDLTAGTSSHIPHRPTYTLRPTFAVHRVAWRPGYQCEIGVVLSTN